MKKLLYIICLSMALLSCERRELTYDYSPYCDVVINLDWANMSIKPTGMTVRAYPQDGGKPVVVQSNNTKDAVLKLPAGVYNILVFNQIPSDFGLVAFRGLDKWETTEVYAKELTTKTWATTKTETSLVEQPEVVAAATYTDVEISQSCIEKSTAHYKLTGERLVAHTLNLKPKIVVKRTLVRVLVDGIQNLRSTRGVLTGMADGYNFATQQSCKTHVSHLLESWKIEDFEYGERFGETNIQFMSFGIPETTTTTRIAEDWKGDIYLQLLLVDNETVIEHRADITTRTTSKDDIEDSKADDDTDVETEVDVETSIVIKIGFSDDAIDTKPVLPDVKPEGGADSGFDATVEDWGPEEDFDLSV